MLGDGGEDLDRQLGGVWGVASDKLDATLLQRADEEDVAREPVELGDDQGRVAQPAGRECGGDLRPVVALAALDLLKLGDDHTLGDRDVARDRLALGIETEPRDPLFVGRDPEIGHKPGHTGGREDPLHPFQSGAAGAALNKTASLTKPLERSPVGKRGKKGVWVLTHFRVQKWRRAWARDPLDG